jgi:hypothetical protein
VFESLRTSIEERYGWVSKKITRTSVWIKIDDYWRKIRTSIKRINMYECLNQYGRVLKKDKDEYQKNWHVRVFESIRSSIEERYGRVSKKITWTSVWSNTDEYWRKIRTSIKENNTGECLNQYRRVLKKDTDEYQRKQHGRVFESIRTSIKERYRRVSKELTRTSVESIRTSIEEIYGRVSKKITRTSVWINIDEYWRKIRTSIKRINTYESLNHYRRVMKKDSDE